jgi:hypothetical protein
MPAPGGCVDPLNWAGCGAVGGAAPSLATYSIFDQMAQWWSNAFHSMTSSFSSAFIHAGDVSIAGLQGSGLWQLEVAVGATLAAGSMLWAGARAAWTRSGEPVATAAVGLVKAVLATAMVFTVVTALLGVADNLTVAIMNASAGSTSAFTSKLSHISSVSGLGDSTALVFIFALFGVVVTATLWIEMLIRAAGIVIVTLSAPIGAGGLLNERTAGWWRKMVTAELALIFIKPIIALVFAVGFTVANGSTGIQGVLVGFMILAASAVAWPVVARLFSFFEATVTAGGAAAAFGLASGMAGKALGGSRSNGSQPMWQSMEEASSRGGPGPSALGASLGPAAAASAAASAGLSGASGLTGASAPAARSAGAAQSASGSSGGGGGSVSGSPDAGKAAASTRTPVPSGRAGAGAAAGAAGVAALAAQGATKHALHTPGRMLGRAADMAAVAGSGPEGLSPPHGPRLDPALAATGDPAPSGLTDT